ncbi:MAG: NAD(P)-dependent alcohol dehydrogenase [Acidobacteria bacterium]|nr:MAG: NAD(P)-dependent alcohol dehydrogenase [Acidobacteriota bacterium]
MKTQAAVCRAVKEPFTLETIELPELRDDEVLVKVVSSGICHTDVSSKNGVISQTFPILLGHEGAGIVEKVGKKVTRLVPGDHVVMCADNCGVCPQCLSGAPTYCLDMPALCFCTDPNGQSATGADGKPILLKYFGQSSFARYALANERNSVKVRKDAPLKYLGPLGCGINTGAGTILNGLKPKPGSSLLVIGAGTVGLSAVMAANLCGCNILVSDLVESRLELAKSMGATHTINGKNEPDLAKAIRAICPNGVDYVVDTAAIMPLLTAAASAMAIRGTLALVGAASADKSVSVNHWQTLTHGHVIQGFIEGHGVPQLFIPQLVDLYMQGRFPFDKLMTFYPLEKINDAVQDQHDGKIIKAVLEP